MFAVVLPIKTGVMVIVLYTMMSICRRQSLPLDN